MGICGYGVKKIDGQGIPGRGRGNNGGWGYEARSPARYLAVL